MRPFTLRLLSPRPMLNDLPLARGKLRRGGLVLALLVLRPEHAAPRPWLREALWPRYPERSRCNPNRFLSTAITLLRDELGEARLPIPRRHFPLRVDLEGADIDWVTFEQANARAEPASLRQVVSCYQAPLLSGFDVTFCSGELQAWIEALRQSAEDRFLAACEQLAWESVRLGELDEMARCLLAAVEVAPFRTTPQRVTMLGHADRGEYLSLIDTYATLCRAPRSELRPLPDAVRPRRLETLRMAAQSWLQQCPDSTQTRGRANAEWEIGFKGVVPPPLTDMIGREEEVATLGARLWEARLLTLLGVGGAGKTRLAIDLARHSARDDPDRVRFVPLEDLSRPELVPRAVASVLGIQETPGLPLERSLVARLQSGPFLLVMDNCEHLVDACAELVERLLAACPQLRILATSRKPLGIAVEATHRLTPLAIAPAVRLFVDRAERVRPGFARSHENGATVMEICRRLDGLPLAIELAAARLKVLTVEEIARDLEDRFGLLTNGRGRARARQRTLRATLEWSEALLLEPARVLWRRLSAFAGGCTRDAVAAVCADVGTIDLLEELADSSLLIVEESLGSARYRMLETVRAYASQRLTDAGETSEVRDRHLAFFTRLGEQHEAQLGGTAAGLALAHLERERDNLRAALDWAYREGDAKRTHQGLRLATSLVHFWELRGYAEKGHHYIEALLAAPTHADAADSTRIRIKALYAAAQLARTRFKMEVASLRSEEALALCRASGLPAEKSTALRKHAMRVNYRGQGAEARALLDQSVSLMSEVGDRRGLADSLYRRGTMSVGEYDFCSGQKDLNECLAIRRELGDLPGVASVLCYLGVAHHFVDPEAARRYYAESLALCRHIGHESGSAYALLRLGTLARHRDDLDAAQACWVEMLTLWRSIGDVPRVACTLFYLGLLARDRGEVVTARSALEEGLALAEQTGSHRMQARILFALSRCVQDDTSATLRARAVAANLEVRESIVPALRVHADGTLAAGHPERAAYLLGAAEAAHVALAAVYPDADLNRLPESDDTVRRVTDGARCVLGNEAFTGAWTAGKALCLEEAIFALLAEN